MTLPLWESKAKKQARLLKEEAEKRREKYERLSKAIEAQVDNFRRAKNAQGSSQPYTKDWGDNGRFGWSIYQQHPFSSLKVFRNGDWSYSCHINQHPGTFTIERKSGKLIYKGDHDSPNEVLEKIRTHLGNLNKI